MLYFWYLGIKGLEMKKNIVVLAISISILFFTACGGGGGGGGTPAPPQVQVNLIGTWSYQTYTQNNVCDGLLAQGVKIVDSLDGDMSTMGNTRTQGTTFKLDANQNCYLAPIDEVTTRTYGVASVMTSDEYLALLQQVTAGDNTIQSIRVDSFNDMNIIKVYTFTNGVIITEQMTR